MPTIQCIPSLEDREFTSSLGSWTGNFPWASDLYFEHEGYIGPLFPPPFSEWIASLAYPHLLAPKNTALTLSFYMAWAYDKNNLTSKSITLSDGVTDIVLTGPDWSGTSHWDYFNNGLNTPESWTEENASLTIRITNGPWWTSRLWHDDFSLTYIYTPPTRPQYLPLVGVG